MKRTLVLVMFVLAVGMVTVTGDQVSQDSIEIGGGSLKLGMAQDVVLHQLGSTFDLQESTSGTWIIAEKGHPSRAVGSVGFEAARLKWVYKYWDLPGRTPHTDAALADALYGAVDSFEREGRTSCTIATGHRQDPTSENKAVFVRCGQKYLRIDIWRISQHEQTASVNEVME